MGEDLLAAERLRDPQHGDAETFEFARIPARVVGAETFDIEAPRAGATELLRPGARVVGHVVKRIRGATLVTSTSFIRDGPSCCSVSRARVASAMSDATSIP